MEHLAELGLRQVKKVLDAYAARDVEKAREVCRAGPGDRRRLHVALPRAPHLHDGGSAQHHDVHHLLFCAKNIERIGDHATNIAETVYYLITGEQWDEPRQSSTRVED